MKLAVFSFEDVDYEQGLFYRVRREKSARGGMSMGNLGLRRAYDEDERNRDWAVQNSHGGDVKMKLYFT